MLNVVFFVGSLHAGGLERFVTSVCLFARQREVFNPAVVCLAGKSGIFVKQLESRSIAVVAAPSGWNRQYRANRGLTALLRRLGADVVHSQVNFSMLQQYLAVSRLPAAFLVTERNMYPLRGLARIRRLIQYHYLRWRGVSYSANSGHVRQHLARLVMDKEENIPVVPNGFMPLAGRPYTRQALGLPDNGYIIGYVARMAAHKGHQLLVQVIYHLVNDWRLEAFACLAGDGPERGNIKRLIEQLNLRQRFYFLGIRDDMERIYPVFDVQLLLSEFEGMPNVVVEGMAYGVPVMARPAGNVTELLAGEAGIVLASANAAGIAAGLAKLLRDKERRVEVGRQARTRIRQLFPIERTVALLAEHYRQQHGQR